MIKEFGKIILLVGLLLVIQAQAFSEPSLAPPGGNISPPVNITAAFQDMAGQLWVDGGLGVGSQTTPSLVVGAGGLFGVGTASPAFKLDVAGTIHSTGLDVAGTAKLGSSGTVITSAGVCIIPAFVLTTTSQAKTCAGVPASTSVAVVCSPSGAFSTATVAVSARASGTADTIRMITSGGNTASLSYTCIWMW